MADTPDFSALTLPRDTTFFLQLAGQNAPHGETVSIRVEIGYGDGSKVWVDDRLCFHGMLTSAKLKELTGLEWRELDRVPERPVDWDDPDVWARMKLMPGLKITAQPGAHTLTGMRADSEGAHG